MDQYGTVLGSLPSATARARWRMGRGTRDDSGSAVIEAALTLPLVFMLIFGMITGGMALSQKNAVENAAREASRFGATLVVDIDVDGTEDWLDAVSEVAITAATGDLDDGVPGQYVCVALVGTSNGKDGRKIISEGTTTYDVDASSAPCPDLSCPANTACVHVSVGREAVLDLVATTRTLTLAASSVSTFERN